MFPTAEATLYTFTLDISQDQMSLTQKLIILLATKLQKFMNETHLLKKDILTPFFCDV